MRYVSTRGASPPIAFDAAMTAGLAPDGGLYMPEAWPAFAPAELEALRGRPYADVAFATIAKFVGGAIPDPDLRAMIDAAYAGFDDARIAPLRGLEPDLHLLELFHGPTLAFKDVALQLLGRLMDWGLRREGRRATVVGATSGDTGSAAIAALAGLATVDVVILHPKGRTSDVQRRQMTTVAAPNVRNAAIEGDFDDCQALVKAMFRDEAYASRLGLAAVNSINWARIAAQAVYYVSAALALGAPDCEIDFAVPTGNFGDVFAGHVARCMGAFRGRLVVATNANDILARTLAAGAYEPRAVTPTTSPSMDIQVSSNFERLIFEALGRDGAAVAGLMDDLARDGRFVLPAAALASIREGFAAVRADEAQVAAEMARTRAEFGLIVDPHTAVGLVAARAAKREGAPMVALATAHPAKFPEAVARASGARPPVPPRLAALDSRPERYDVLANDLETVKTYVAAASSAAKDP